MPRFLLRLEDDLFVEWSTVVDAPVSNGMTLAQVKEFIESDNGRSEAQKPAALERLVRTGTSHYDTEDYNLDGALVCNRAGPGERHLTKKQLIVQVRATLRTTP